MNNTMVFESRKEFNNNIKSIASRLGFSQCDLDNMYGDFGFLRPFDEKYDPYIKIVYNGNNSTSSFGGYSVDQYYEA